MHPTTSKAPPDSVLGTGYSGLRAFAALVVHSFQRHWRVRQMGWVAVGLLAVAVVAVAVVTHTKAGWSVETRRVPKTRTTYREAADQLRADHRYFGQQYLSQAYGDPAARPLPPAAYPQPLDPTRDALQTLILSVPSAVLSDQKFLHDWAFMNFSRWVVLGAYLGVVLPLFTLAYASAAIGAERESGTLVWVMSRPIPRWAVYLAKLLGALPWCLLFGGGGFVALCLAGGKHGREALALYWPAVAYATIAFTALFHLVGANFRRPVVVGWVYAFFYEVLVGALPGSLKLLSLGFYARSLMYNGASTAGYPVDMLGVSQPVSPETARTVLLAAAAGLTVLGMWLFNRGEYRDDV